MRTISTPHANRTTTIGSAKLVAQPEREALQNSAQNARMIEWKSKHGFATDASRRRRKKLQNSSRCSTPILGSTVKLPDYFSQDTEDTTSMYPPNRPRVLEKKNAEKSPTI